jgi:hypothetical protein
VITLQLLMRINVNDSRHTIKKELPADINLHLDKFIATALDESGLKPMPKGKGKTDMTVVDNGWLILVTDQQGDWWIERWKGESIFETENDALDLVRMFETVPSTEKVGGL